MYSQLYKQLRDELRDKNGSDVLGHKQLVLCEQQIFKDLLASEGKCRKCPRTEKLTLDHVVPKFILQSFGVDVERELIEGNYTLLCSPCNQFKSGRLDFSIPETKAVLLQLLERV